MMDQTNGALGVGRKKGFPQPTRGRGQEGKGATADMKKDQYVPMKIKKKQKSLVGGTNGLGKW